MSINAFTDTFMNLLLGAAKAIKDILPGGDGDGSPAATNPRDGGAPKEAEPAADGHKHGHDHEEKKKLKEGLKRRGEGAKNIASWGAELARATNDPALAKAVNDLAVLAEKGSKNGAGNEKALGELVAKLQYMDLSGFPAEVEKTAGRLQREAEEELAKVRQVRRAVATFTGGKKENWDPKNPFDKDGEFNKEGAVRIKAPPKGVGLADTAGPQIEKFLALVGKEAERSNAFAELLVKVANNPTQIDMFICKNSCGFCDSPALKSLDMDDFDCLLDDPIKDDPTKVKDGTGNALVGLCKGEILMHVFEERLHMFQSGDGNKEYIDAHLACLGPGSHQNLYRQEIGLASDTTDLDEIKVGTGESFVQRASDGVEAKFPVNTAKSGDPEAHRDYKPDPEQMKYERTQGDPIEARIAACLESTMKVWRRNPQLKDGKWDDKEFDLRMNGSDLKNNQRLLRYWLGRKLGDDAAAVEKEYKRLMDDLKERCRRLPDENPARIKQKTEAVKNLLAEDPKTPGSAELKKLREARDKAGPINDAENQKNLSGQSDNLTNCAVTTLGAFLGKNSTDVLTGMLGDKADKYKGTQDPGIWSLMERGLNGTQDKDPELRGDAQLRGIRKTLLKVVEERNKKGGNYELVQDGLNEEGAKGGKMYPVKEMTERMQTYPDGTQFQVFVNGGIDHWVYAEMYNGKLVFEDYQTSSTKTGKTQDGCVAQADMPPGSMPDHPVSGNPDTFEMGMFLAVAPKGAAKAEPFVDPKGNWPPPGSEKDKQMTALVEDVRKDFNVSAVLSVLPKHAEALKGFRCDLGGLPGAVKKITEGEAAASPDQFALKAEVDGGREAVRQGKAEIQAIVKAVDCLQMRQLVREMMGEYLDAERAAKATPFADDPSNFVKQLKSESAKRNVPTGAAYATALEAWGKLSGVKDWSEEQVRQAQELVLEPMRKAIDATDAGGVPGLKAHMEKIAKSMGVAARLKEHERKKQAAAALPDVATFEKLAANPDELAKLLKLDEVRADAQSRREEATEKQKACKAETDEFVRSLKQKEPVTWEQVKKWGSTTKEGEQKPGELSREKFSEKQGLEKKEESLKAEAEWLDKALAVYEPAAFAKAVKNVKDTSDAVYAALKQFDSAPPKSESDLGVAESALRSLESAVDALRDPVVMARMRDTVYKTASEAIEGKRPQPAESAEQVLLNNWVNLVKDATDVKTLVSAASGSGYRGLKDEGILSDHLSKIGTLRNDFVREIKKGAEAARRVVVDIEKLVDGFQLGPKGATLTFDAAGVKAKIKSGILTQEERQKLAEKV